MKKTKKIGIIFTKNEITNIINSENYNLIRNAFKHVIAPEKMYYFQKHEISFILSFFRKDYEHFTIFFDFNWHDLTFSEKDLTSVSKQNKYTNRNKEYNYSFYFFNQLMRKEKLKNL